MSDLTPKAALLKRLLDKSESIWQRDIRVEVEKPVLSSQFIDWADPEESPVSIHDCRYVPEPSDEYKAKFPKIEKGWYGPKTEHYRNLCNQHIGRLHSSGYEELSNERTRIIFEMTGFGRLDHPVTKEENRALVYPFFNLPEFRENDYGFDRVPELSAVESEFLGINVMLSPKIRFYTGDKRLIFMTWWQGDEQLTVLYTEGFELNSDIPYGGRRSTSLVRSTSQTFTNRLIAAAAFLRE